MTRLRTLALNLLTILVTITAIGLGGFRVNQYVGAWMSQRAVRIDGWREYSREGIRVGPDSAAVTIVEFADFQCPYCRLASRDLALILDRYYPDVALIYRHYPLASYTFAVPAAKAAECAAESGRFRAFYEYVYSKADSIGSKPWVSYARDAGVPDLASFELCVASPDPVKAIHRDTIAGNALGITGTPMFLVNDLRVPNYPGTEKLIEYVEDALSRLKE